MPKPAPPRSPEGLPTEPPSGADHLVWRLSHQVWTDHTRGADGFCVVCRPHQPHPCPARALAATGMTAAMVFYSMRPAVIRSTSGTRDVL